MAVYLRSEVAQRIREGTQALQKAILCFEEVDGYVAIAEQESR